MTLYEEGANTIARNHTEDRARNRRWQRARPGSSAPDAIGGLFSSGSRTPRSGA